MGTLVGTSFGTSLGKTPASGANISGRGCCAPATVPCGLTGWSDVQRRGLERVGGRRERGSIPTNANRRSSQIVCRFFAEKSAVGVPRYGCSAARRFRMDQSGPAANLPV